MCSFCSRFQLVDLYRVKLFLLDHDGSVGVSVRRGAMGGGWIRVNLRRGHAQFVEACYDGLRAARSERGGAR